MVGFVRRRIAVQVTLLLLLGAMVPLTGAALILLRRTETRIEKEIAAEHGRLARIAATLADDYVAGALAKVEAISHLLKSAGDNEDPNELAGRLNDLLLPNDSIIGLNYIRGGKQFAQAVQTMEQQEGQILMNGQRGAYQSRGNARTTQELDFGNWALGSGGVKNPPPQTAVNDTNLNPGINTLTLGSGVREGSTVFAHLNFDPLSLTLQGVTAGGARELVLLDADGAVMAASSKDLHPAWHTTGHAAGEKWTLLVRQPADVAYAPLTEARAQIFTWLGVAFALALVASVALSSWILRPVRALTGAAGEIERGNLAARARIERPDEIGRLAATFDRMAAAVEALDSAKSEFVANVSHELRTPLTSIKCSIANLQEGIGGPEVLGRVRDDIDRLIKMVNDLLDLARLDAGRVALAKSDVDLAALARECAASLRPLGGDVVVEGAGRAEADSARLHQVVTNLLDNAIKFSGGGRVVVRVEDGKLAVQDSGPGVPPEAQNRVFEKFVQIEDASGVKSRGAGLGLSIAKKIVELHGGTMRVEGSTFTVELPRG